MKALSLQHEPKTQSFSWGRLFKKYNLFFLLLLFMIVGSCLSPKFLTIQNLLNLLQQSSIMLAQHHFSAPIAILLAIFIGALLGLINGVVSTRLRVPAFITTLAMMVAARGLALLFTDGQPIYNLPASFQWLGGNLFGQIPISAILWIVLTLLAFFVLKYTVFVRKLYAIGGNAQSAHLSGFR